MGSSANDGPGRGSAAGRVGRLAFLLLAACLGGCGGGGGNAGVPDDWTPGVFLPADRYAAKCASPRSGTDPQTGRPYPDVRGSAVDENNWLRSWSNDLYLWYDEITDRDPADYTTPTYFDHMKTTARTPSGNPKDRFHFTYPTDVWVSLSQSGISAGYGAEWAIIADLPPRKLVVAYTQPNSPATAARPVSPAGPRCWRWTAWTSCTPTISRA